MPLKPIVKIYKAYHNDTERLFIEFHYNKQLVGIVKQLEGVVWSVTKKAWHIEFSEANLASATRIFESAAVIASITYDIPLPGVITPNNQTEQSKPRLDAGEIREIEISFRQYLRNCRYSDSTIKSYSNGLTQFLKQVDKPPVDITNNDLLSFGNFLVDEKYSISFQNQVISAIKTYFKKIHARSLVIEKINRPRGEHKLPNVLSKQEVKKIIEAPANLKHQAMLGLIYACGLRRTELLNLKPLHVDSARGVLTILNAKGKKDRVVPLSDKIIEILRNYYKIYRPTTWLFEGYEPGKRYSEEALSKVLKNACRQSRIHKPVTLHWLRHSYATHLLESGVDLRYIQELLGHKSSKTTEIYTHVTIKSLQKIKSPYDDL